MDIPRAALLPTLLALLGAAADANGGAPRASADPLVTRVSIDERVYPLITDFDANGVPESLLVRTERREEPGRGTRVHTRIDLLEEVDAGHDFGLLQRGRRYRYVSGGRLDLDGLGPDADDLDAADALPGARQARYGMLALVVLPLRRTPAGATAPGPLVLYNTERGLFRVAHGEASFAEVGNAAARAEFARSALGARPPATAPSAAAGPATAIAAAAAIAAAPRAPAPPREAPLDARPKPGPLP